MNTEIKGMSPTSLGWDSIFFTLVVMWDMKLAEEPQSTFSTWNHGHLHAQSMSLKEETVMKNENSN